MKEYIVWDSDIWMDNLEDWKESYIETCEANEIEIDIENITENDIFDYAQEMNNNYLDDERANLNIEIPNGIFAIADIGLWNGRVTGYKEIGNNISDCLYSDTDCAKWYVDNHGVFHARFADHDGSTFAVYKAWKDNVTEEQKEHLLDNIYNGICTKRMLRRYTNNIGGKIANVYGWKVSTGKKN